MTTYLLDTNVVVRLLAPSAPEHSKKAAAETIMGDVDTTLTRARARGGKWAELAEKMIGNAMKIWFPGEAVWVKFIGTHEAYDRIDVRAL